MSTSFYTQKLGEYLRDKIKAALEGELGLKICMFGYLEQVFYPPSEGVSDYGDAVPAVFIEPQLVQMQAKSLGPSPIYYQENTLHIVYVDRIAEGAGVVHEAKRLAVTRLADVVVQNLIMADLGALDRANREAAWFRGINFRPQEDVFVRSCNAQLCAATFDVAIKLVVW